LNDTKSLLYTIDLIIIVMLNSENNQEYIKFITQLSEQAQDDMQELIMRSRSKLDDLIS